MDGSAKRLPLTTDEAVCLARYRLTPREKRVVWTLLDTGLRVSELASITSDQVDFSFHLLYAGCGGSTALRAVPLTARIEPLLEARFRHCRSLGLGARSIERVIGDVAERAGMKRLVCPEALRATFAVAAARSGKSPLELRRLLGLKRLAAVEVYFAFVNEQSETSSFTAAASLMR